MRQTKIDELSALAEALYYHPSFDRAAGLYVSNVIAWRRSLGLFNRIGTDLGFHIIYYVVVLHFARAGQNAEHGATFTNVLKICTARQQCGSRALRTVLAACTMIGLLRVQNAEGDQRIKVYVPSQKLLADMRGHLSLTLACLDIIVGEERYASRMLNDTAFLPQFMATSGHSYIELGITVSESIPELHSLMLLRGGYPTAAALTDAHLRGITYPTPSAIARDFSISASQVRNVLATANAQGLITSDPSGRVTHVVPLVDQLKATLARELALYGKYGLGLEHELCVPA
jgi:hypothetical protein